MTTNQNNFAAKVQPPVPPAPPVTPQTNKLPSLPRIPPSSTNPVLAGTPGWRFDRPTPITPADAKRVVDARVLDESKIYKPSKVMSFAGNTVAGAPSIVELARALRNDPQLIFEHVYNNVEWEPGWGVQKGGLGCLIDGMGNSFDQSMLLVELLRQAGFTADYVLGTLTLTETQTTDWFNTAHIFASYYYVTYANIPAVFPVWNGSEYTMDMNHVWVQVVVGGNTYVLDPSFKSYTRTAPVANLGTILGYNAATFLSNAQSGATIDGSGNFVQNMNTANINTDLTTMSTNLTTWIKANMPTANMDDILGGQSIVPITLPFTWSSSLPYQKVGDVPTIWTTDVPLAYKTTLQVQFDWNGTGYNIDQTFTSDQLAGKRLTLSSNGSLQPILSLDGTVLQTGAVQGAGTWQSALLTVNHNAYAFPVYPQQWFQQFIYAEQFYLIGNAWGNLGPGQANYHQKLLTQAIADPVSTSEQVNGELTSYLWFNLVSQASRVADLVGRLTATHMNFFHQVGIVSYTYDVTNQECSGATDIGGVSGFSSTLDYDFTKLAVANTVIAMHGVALEAAVLSQYTGKPPGVSTTTVIDAANTAGDKIYKGTSTNWNTGANISATLVANGYNSTDMGNIYTNYLASGGSSVVLSENPNQTIGPWSASGDWIFPTYSNNGGAFGLIQVTAKGGKSFICGMADLEHGILTPFCSYSDWNADGSYIYDPVEDPKSQAKSADPVGLACGDFYHTRDDIKVGSADFPYSLTFGRFYNSGKRNKKNTLGFGWAHRHDLKVQRDSNGYLAMGQHFALQGVATIAELFVAIDLATDTTQPINKLVTMSLADKWWIDQIVNNTVAVIFPESMRIFVKQPDGTYTAPAESPSVLALVSGLYTLTTPQGVKYNFNSSGQIATIVFPNGVTVTYTYASGLLSTISNGLGRTLTLGYTSGRITSVSDGNGRSITYGYDGNNNLTSAVDTLSHAVSYQYDLPGRMTKIFLPANPLVAVVTNVYDTLGRVQTQANARNQISTFYFAGSRTEEVNPVGSAKVLYFNRFGKEVRIINSLGKVVRKYYDNFNRIIEVVAPEGNKIQWTYDKNNNALTQTFVAKPGSGLSNIQYVRAYDPVWAKISSTTDGAGNVNSYSYDAFTGDLISASGPVVGGSSPIYSYAYNARGQVVTVADPTGVVSRFNYDISTEKLTSVVQDYNVSLGHLNLTTSIGYDSVGNITSVTDPRSNQTIFAFDSERRITQTTVASPFSYVTNYVYDFNGNLVSIQKPIAGSNAGHVVSRTFSVTDKVATVTDVLGRVTTLSYDGNDRLQSTLDPAGRLVQYTYDVLDRVSTVIDPASIVAETVTYSDNGLTVSRKDAKNNLTQYSYDGFDRLITTTFADLSTSQVTAFNNNSMPLTFVNRAGNTTTLTYDALNRLSTQSPFGQATVTFTYDLAGRILSVSKPTVGGDVSTGTFQRFYDTAGRFFKEQYPDGKIVLHELDNNGNRTKTTWPDGYFITRSFDQLNRLVSIFLNGSGTPSATHFYDELSRRTLLTYGNGTSTSYTFALNGDLVAMTHNFVGAPNNYSYGFNPSGELIATDMSDTSYLWRPSSAGANAYGTADNINRYPTVGGTSYTYDGNKNLIGDGTWTFGYNTENKLLTANKSGVSASYSYDPQGRQAQKTVNSVATRFIYDDLNLIATYDGSGALLSRYIHGSMLDEPQIQVSSAGVITYLHKDSQGSVVAVTDSTGFVTNKLSYSPFGESSLVAGSIFGYTSQRFDSETGLYYYKNRHYSPNLGRFMQTDPIGYAAGNLNLYQYVGNNPLNFADPLGLAADKKKATKGLIDWLPDGAEEASIFNDDKTTFVDETKLKGFKKEKNDYCEKFTSKNEEYIHTLKGDSWTYTKRLKDGTVISVTSYEPGIELITFPDGTSGTYGDRKIPTEANNGPEVLYKNKKYTTTETEVGPGWETNHGPQPYPPIPPEFAPPNYPHILYPPGFKQPVV